MAKGYVKKPIDGSAVMPYTIGVKIDFDGRVWFFLGSTRRCLAQILSNGRLVYRFRDARADGSIPELDQRGGTANVDAIVRGARASVIGRELVIRIPLF